ncbi:MAG: Rieske (2Fe-2S) protein [Congregibacter sp.]
MNDKAWNAEHLAAPQTSPQWVELCHISELQESRALGFDPFREGKASVFVIKKNASLYAYGDHCPHYGTTPLPWKKNEYLDKAGDVIVCAAHGARFDITTGICISGPCLGQSLSAIALHVRRDGQLFADVQR